MSKKQNVQKMLPPPPAAPLEDETDDELEYVPQKAPSKTTKSAPIPTPESAFQQPPAAKPKQKRNITEEHKAVLRERLKVAHQRKQELAEERKKIKELEEQNHTEKKQLAILREAEKLKKKREKELKQIEIPIAPAKKEKKKVVVYYDEDDEESEEEEIVIKPSKKNTIKPLQQQIAPAIQQPAYPQPVHQPPPAFQIKFC